MWRRLVSLFQPRHKEEETLTQEDEDRMDMIREIIDDSGPEPAEEGLIIEDGIPVGVTAVIKDGKIQPSKGKLPKG